MIKRVYLFLNIFLFSSVLTYGQFHKGSCIIDYRININDPILLNNYLFSDNFQSKWNETILKLQEKFKSISTSNKKFEIKNDTLFIAKKISVKGKVQYNISKFPLKKLTNVTFSFKELVIYSKWKEIVVERFGYKKLTTSQITLFKNVDKNKMYKIMELFDKLIVFNEERLKNQF